MSANSLRHVVRRREHRERAQPAARAARFGLLEKHKDYKLRAVDYHRKKDTTNKLKEKAAMRNQDEFYHSMESSKTKNGVHVLKRDNSLAPATVKMMKSQDLSYLRTQASTDAKKIEKLKEKMHFLMEDETKEEEDEDEEDDGDEDNDDDDDDNDASEPSLPPRKRAKKNTSSSSASAIRSKHVIFVDNTSELQTFKPSAYFGTAPELVGRTYNRLRKEQLGEGNIIINQTQDAVNAQRDAAAATSSSNKTALQRKLAAQQSTLATHALQARADQSVLSGYKELSARLERKRKIQTAVEKLQVERNLAGKGPRVRINPQENKFGEVDETKVVYKWKTQRKR